MTSTVSESATDGLSTSAPVLRIITPSTTPEEIAAIVAVLSSLGGGAPEAVPARSPWTSAAHRLGVRVAGTGAWRASALPR